MVRRVPKQTRDWYGVKRSANEIIKKFLAEGEGRMFGEISAHLQSEGITYSKKGLHLRLQNLIKSGVIEKRDQDHKPYPTYHIKVKSNDMSFLGWWLKYYIDQIRWRDIESQIYVKKLDEKLEFRIMTTLIGVYALFAEIQSWRLVSTKKSYQQNFDIRSSFLSEALPLLMSSSENEFKQREWNSEMGLIPKMYTELDYREKMFEYEKFLEKTFPMEYNWCKEAFEAAKEASKVLKIKFPR